LSTTPSLLSTEPYLEEGWPVDVEHESGTLSPLLNDDDDDDDDGDDDDDDDDGDVVARQHRRGVEHVQHQHRLEQAVTRGYNALTVTSSDFVLTHAQFADLQAARIIRCLNDDRCPSEDPAVSHLFTEHVDDVVLDAGAFVSVEAAAAAAIAANAAAPLPRTNSCIVCDVFPLLGMEPRDYASHLRTHKTDTYTHHAQHLQSWNIGLCEVGGEARPLTKQGRVFKHKCGHDHHSGSGESFQDAQVFPRPPEWDPGLPWPDNLPYPPPGTPHPTSLINTHRLVRSVPGQHRQLWAQVVVRACDSLSDAIEVGSEADQACALVDMLSMPAAIRKAKRGGKSGNKLFQLNMQAVLTRLESRESPEPRNPEFESVPRMERDDPDRSRIHAADTECRLGHLGRAARLLRSTEDILEPSFDLTERLQGKFPSPRSAISGLNPLPANAPRFMMEEEDFVKLLRGVLSGAAGGASGLRGDHIKPLLDLPDVARALHRLFAHVIDADFPDWAHPYISQQVAIALGAKERPICMGEFISRTASAMVNRTVSQDTDRSFFLQMVDGQRVFQLGNSVKGGQR
jgi:hypothetical protein